ncbi:hypothetical protein [Aquitalea magnusonii]|uniref:hypothetical protein n=1 Tax=Aquitalea magnusonii TaxID=332411 RepID=UPI000A5D5802|nr:hypothetical protein [Aquitalea magnusonii]
MRRQAAARPERHHRRDRQRRAGTAGAVRLATLIHGHTHRPATHRHQQGSRQAERWVIRDWHGTEGAYLRLDASGLMALPLG